MKPLDMVRDLNRRYPTAWRDLDRFRALKGREGIPDWPAWCWCPLAGSYAVATQGSDDRLPSGNAVAEIGAVAAWRASQGIYRIHPELMDPLSETKLDDIPAEWFFQLPEWCIWVEVEPGGFFAHLESDSNTGRAELRFWIVPPQGHSYPLIVHLDRPTLTEGVDAAISEANRNSIAGLAGGFSLPKESIEHMKKVSAMFASLVVYVISAIRHDDIRDSKGIRKAPSRQTATPNHPTVWEVGWKQGEAFRAALSKIEAGGSHSSPRPHVRRAHWHHFWEGPHNGERKLSVRWMPPTFVGTGDIIPTIHEI